jgi:hypothetical protein
MRTTENNEATNTSHARIKPPAKISEPSYIRFEALESVQEEYQAKQRERILDVKMRGWV